MNYCHACKEFVEEDECPFCGRETETYFHVLLIKLFGLTDKPKCLYEVVHE